MHGFESGGLKLLYENSRENYSRGFEFQKFYNNYSKISDPHFPLVYNQIKDTR